MKSAGKARSNGLYRHIRTSKEIIRNLLNDFKNNSNYNFPKYHLPKKSGLLHLRNNLLRLLTVMLVKLLGMYSFYLMCMPTAC